MLALELQDIKSLMNCLLREEGFDPFGVAAAEIRGQARFTIDGHTPEGELVTWGYLRPVVFAMVRGKEKPRRLKLTLSAPASWLEKIDPAAAACLLNLHYEGDRAQVTTGRTARGFSLDKSADGLWDDAVKRFLQKQGLAFRELI